MLRLFLLQNNQRGELVTASNESKVYLKNDRVVSPKRSDNYRSSNLGGPGHADQVINGDIIKDAPTLTTGLNGLARGVDFSGGVAYLKESLVVSQGAAQSEPMLLVVDGIVTSQGSLDAINPNSVETVEVLKRNSAAIYGTAGGAGVIVVTTRQGSSSSGTASKEMSPGGYSFTPNGLYKAKEFYAPHYDVTQPVSKLPDARTTIFWKPDVVTGADGSAAFNFFNADGAGTYRVVIEGIDSKGNLGRQVYKYKVE